VKIKLEYGPMPNVVAALPNIDGALCSTPQSLAGEEKKKKKERKKQDKNIMSASATQVGHNYFKEF